MSYAIFLEDINVKSTGEVISMSFKIDEEAFTKSVLDRLKNV